MQELYVLNQVMLQYLRGGSDSIHSCIAIHNSMLKGLNDADITEHAIQMIEILIEKL